MHHYMIYLKETDTSFISYEYTAESITQAIEMVQAEKPNCVIGAIQRLGTGLPITDVVSATMAFNELMKAHPYLENSGFNMSIINMLLCKEEQQENIVH
ncbi:hypothetical protein [Marinobacterium litorale]|uniref:hypothetical protein n=1 Tax=Marinobacterium litorale TaxID=404770 RepID=UPI0003F60A99|nr:hypothetical protein [Marinobacterium litorale]